MAPFTSVRDHLLDKGWLQHAALHFPFMKISRLSTNMPRTSENHPHSPHGAMPVLPMLEKINLCLCKLFKSLNYCWRIVTDFVNMKILLPCAEETVVMMDDSKKSAIEAKAGPVQEVWNTKVQVSMAFSTQIKITTDAKDKIKIKSEELKMERDVELLDWLLDWELSEEQDESGGEGEVDEADGAQANEEEASETDWSEEEDSDWPDDGDSDMSAENTELWQSFFTNDLYNPLCFSCPTGSKTKPSDIQQRSSLSSSTADETEKIKSAELHSLKKQRAKQVRFSEDITVHLMDWCLDSEAARSGSCWLELVRDRDRFRRRVENTEKILKFCLTSEHRAKVWDSLQKGA